MPIVIKSAHDLRYPEDPLAKIDADIHAKQTDYECEWIDPGADDVCGEINGVLLSVSPWTLSANEEVVCIRHLSGLLCGDSPPLFGWVKVEVVQEPV